MSSSLVICDREEGYAASFAAFLMKKKELAFQVQVCKSLAQVQALQREQTIDILLIHEACPREEREQITAGKVFVLAESSKADLGAKEYPVYKYQSGEAILAEVIAQCGQPNHSGSMFLTPACQARTSLIGIFSPVHRSGKTSYGLKLGQSMAASENVLYLNLELYGGIGGHFPAEGHTLADVLYYVRQENKDLGWILATLVSHMNGLDYLLPARVSEDVKSVPAQDWLELLGQILDQSMYDVVILDLDEGIQGIYEVLRMCTEIHMPVARDMTAKAKVFQLEEELHLLGYDDVRTRLQKKEMRQ